RARSPGGSRRRGRGGPHDGGDAGGGPTDHLRGLRLVVPGGIQGASGGGNPMTGADPANEQVAQRLAERGRDALVERLREAYAQAAEAHADVLSIDSDRLETIVQGAADRADGLQWRRTLADLASGELGISLTDALAHPAVARAQDLVGAASSQGCPGALGRRPAGRLSTERSVNGGSSEAQTQAQS